MRIPRTRVEKRKSTLILPGFFPSSSRDSGFAGIPPRLRRGFANRQKEVRTQASLARTSFDDLRRMRDSNPRYVAVQQFSRLPPSTTRPFLHIKRDAALQTAGRACREPFANRTAKVWIFFYFDKWKKKTTFV